MKLGVVVGLIIVAVILALSLKSRNPEISSMVSLAIGLVIIGICIGRIRVIIDVFNSLSELVKIDRLYIVVLLKLIGVAYICEFASGISRDAGYTAVASQIELLGKLTMLTVSLPVFLQVIERLLELLGQA